MQNDLTDDLAKKIADKFVRATLGVCFWLIIFYGIYAHKWWLIGGLLAGIVIGVGRLSK